MDARSLVVVFTMSSMMSWSALYGQVQDGYYTMKIGRNMVVRKVEGNRIKTYGLHDDGDFSIGIGVFKENKEDSSIIVQYKVYKHNYDRESDPYFPATDTLKLVRKEAENTWLLKRHILRDSEYESDLKEDIRWRRRGFFMKRRKPSKRNALY